MIVSFITALLIVGTPANPCEPSTQAILNADGTRSEIVTVYPSLVSASSSSALDVVFVGEGFTEEEFGLFDAKVSEAIAYLSHPPFSARAFNFYRVFLHSKESGADHPRHCPEPTCRDTPLDARFGAADPQDWYFDERYLQVDTERAIDAAEMCGQDYDQIVVLVNDNAYGAIADPVNPLLTVSIGQGFENNLLHEMGHKFAGLGDEYVYLDYGYPAGWDITEPNVTHEGEPEKWTSTLTGAYPIVDAPISGDLVSLLTQDSRFSGMSECTLRKMVGLWEGARGWPTGAYRPQFTCKMRQTTQDFCAVCVDAIENAVISRCPEDLTVVDASLLAESFQCVTGVTLSVALPPCLKCLIATEAEAGDGMDFSEADVASVEIGPLPGVETVNLVEAKPQGSRRIVATVGPLPSGPFFELEFGINPDARYYIEFSPVSCDEDEPYLHFTVGLTVNGQVVDL